MTTNAWPRTSRVNAEAALEGAAKLWFAVALIGQWAFLYYILAFYGRSTLTGHFEVWRKNTFLKGYVAGDTFGNLFFAAHVLLAAIVTFGGALQLIPRIRARAPHLHRWNGRVFLVTAIATSLAGLYMVWVRGINQTLDERLAVTLDAALIFAFAGLAWRAALRREIAAHRRWALRVYLVANGVWFMRIGVMAWTIFNRGQLGGFDHVWAFGSYLVPLGVLELYLRARDGAAPRWRLAMAGGLMALTAVMSVGILGVAVLSWRPLIKKAQDNRPSIADVVETTLAAGGVESAARQFRTLRASAPAAYDFDEGELNALGYRLMRAGRLKEAIAVFQLNVEAFPRSSNVYDSLGEAYLNDGNTSEAAANYRRSLELNPGNRGAETVLAKLR